MKLLKNISCFRLRSIWPQLVVLLSLVAVTGCQKEPFSYQDQVRTLSIMDVIRKDTSLSLTVQALDKAQLSGTLNTYGPFTLFAPDNNAFRAYLANNGKAGIADLSDEDIKTLMIYHILAVRLKSADFVPGPQPYSTGRGDYIALDISKGTKTDALANGKARLYQTDIEFSNGIVHRMDAVLDPPVLTIGEYLKLNPQYSIMVAGLEKAGLMDTLTNLTNAAGARTQLTIFAETNDVFQAAGITSFDNMSLDEVKGLMRYHLVAGGSFTTQYAGLTSAVPAIGLVERWDNTLSTLSPNMHIYYDMAGLKPVNGFIDFRGSDIVMRNGVLHNVDKHMVFGPSVPRTQIMHIFTDAVNYAYGLPSISETAAPILSTTSGRWRYFAETGHTRANAFVLYFEPDTVGDSLVSIVKNVRVGKYKIAVNYKSGTRGDLQLMIGDEKIGPVKNYGAAPTFYQNMELGTYDFKTAGDKRFKWVVQAARACVMDALVLTPVN